MEKIVPLTVYPNTPRITPHEEESRVAQLQATVEHYIPNFAKAVKAAANEVEDAPLILTQDAFAANYDMDEYTLLGMAMKYAGLHNVLVYLGPMKPRS